MKKYSTVVIAFLFSALCFNVFAQKSYSFEVLKTGNGKKSIIFIPGFASSGDVWKETRAVFEKDFSCYTLTMSGFAGTKPSGDASFDNWKNSIATFIKNQKIEKPIIVGHSMGGGLALALATDYPDLIGSIVVVDALPCLAALTDPSFKSKVNNDCTAMTNQMLAMSNEEFYEMQKKSMPRLLENESKLEMVVDWSVKSDRKTFGQLYCDFYNTDLRAKIAAVKCPSLILLESYFINLKPAIESQYQNLKTAQFEYASKGMHFIMYDDPSWFMAQLTNFIKS
ncbi:alpha/beta fold hydrolase [Flavobacterium procerum]|uniref:Alpha/beta fold hydrolase n=1 Tax=Flavobacterium procerum TaxID=1455569 RepID=A0ABV6BJK0_9FLAO